MSIKKKKIKKVRRNLNKKDKNIKKTNFYLFRERTVKFLLYIEMVLMVIAFVAAALFDYYYFYLAIGILLVLIALVYPGKIEFKQNKQSVSSGKSDFTLIGEE